MTDQSSQRDAVLARRLTQVGITSSLNAEALKLTQALAGMEMDALRIELEMRKSGRDEQLVQDLHQVQQKAETVQAAKADCEERIAIAEQEIASLDRLLAAVDQTLGGGGE